LVSNEDYPFNFEAYEGKSKKKQLACEGPKQGCAIGGPQPGPPSHLVWPLPTLRFFPILHENPNPTVYVKN